MPIKNENTPIIPGISSSDLEQQTQAAIEVGNEVLAIILAGQCPYDTPPTLYRVTATHSNDTGNTLSLKEAFALFRNCNATDPVAIQFDSSLQGQTLSGDGLELIVQSGETLSLEGDADLPTAIRFPSGDNALYLAASDGGQLALSHLDLADNSESISYGAAIRINNASATFDNVSIRHLGSNENGAALSLNQADVAISNSTFEFNHSLQQAGAIWSKDSNLSITSSAFLANRADAVSVGKGGAIASVSDNGSGSLSITDVSFEGNSGAYGGGALYVDGTPEVTITDSLLEDNQSIAKPDLFGDPIASAHGGAISAGNDATVILARNTFIGNLADGGVAGASGGAIHVREAGGQGSLHLENNSMINNQATAASGQPGTGGALSIDSASAFDMTVDGSSFSNNQAQTEGGAMIINGPGAVATVRNSTLNDNHAGDSGGAVQLTATDSNQVSFLFNTLVNNRVDAAGSGASALHASDSTGFTLKISHSLFQGNTGGTGTMCNDNGESFIDLHYSFIDTGLNDQDCKLAPENASNLLGSDAEPLDPQLEPFGLYGGNTLVFMPADGSPVIDSGNPNLIDAPGRDQRGSDRIYNGVADMGSVEWGTNNEALLTVPQSSGGGSAGLAILALCLLLAYRKKSRHY